MWWTVFTIVDFWIGLIVLDAMAPSLPLKKLNRLRAVRKVVVALLVISGIVLLVQIAIRFHWLRP